LPLWNKQIDEISVGGLIQVENANIIIFRGVRQLKVGRSGKVSVVKNSSVYTFMRFIDGFSLTSSITPQKKNPDVL